MRAMGSTAEEQIWATEGARKRQAVQRMFVEIAPRYDTLNSLMSLSLHKRWRQTAVDTLRLKPSDSALDVCCGTGDFLVPLRAAVTSGRVTGIDFCAPMLAQAKLKATAQLTLGDVCCLPIQSEVFDGATVGWGIRNVADIDAAHREIVRVLRPGARFASLDMAQPRNAFARAVCGLAFKVFVPALGLLFGNARAYTYLPKSTQRFWTREDLCNSMARAGLTEVGYRDLFFGNICLHFGAKPLRESP